MRNNTEFLRPESNKNKKKEEEKKKETNQKNGPAVTLTPTLRTTVEKFPRRIWN